MDSDLYGLAERIGAAGALMLLIALVALDRGLWFPRAYVDQLRTQLLGLERRLDQQQRQHEQETEQLKGEIDRWEQRTFNALGVADRLSRISETQVLGSRRSRTGPKSDTS